jgi:hypothetical protein
LPLKVLVAQPKLGPLRLTLDVQWLLLMADGNSALLIAGF